VIAEHVPDRRGAQFGILREDCIQRDPDLVRIGRVGGLQDQKRLDRLDELLRASVFSPSIGRILELASGATHENRVEVAGLVRDVENKCVLEPARTPDAHRIDDNRR